MKRRAPNDPSEADIQKAIWEYLDRLGYMPGRMNSGALVGEATATARRRFVKFNSWPGCSDLLACQPGTGKLVAVEVKRPGWKEPTMFRRLNWKTKRATVNPEFDRWEKQKAFLERVMANHGIACIARSLDDVVEALDGKIRNE